MKDDGKTAYDLIYRATHTAGPFVHTYAADLDRSVLAVLGLSDPADRVRLAVEDALWHDFHQMRWAGRAR